MPKVEVYGADWCEDTRRTRQYLESQGIAYEYVNLDWDANASEWVKRQNDGKERKPTVKIGERLLSVPSDQELANALRQQGLLS